MTSRRAERGQVEDMLAWSMTDSSTIESICRDWLDMDAREARLVRLWKDDPTVSDEFGKRCFWCDAFVEDYQQPIAHFDGCAWRLVVAESTIVAYDAQGATEGD